MPKGRPALRVARRNGVCAATLANGRAIGSASRIASIRLSHTTHLALKVRQAASAPNSAATSKNSRCPCWVEGAMVSSELAVWPLCALRVAGFDPCLGVVNLLLSGDLVQIARFLTFDYPVCSPLLVILALLSGLLRRTIPCPGLPIPPCPLI